MNLVLGRRALCTGVAASLALALVQSTARAQLFSFPDWYTLANAASQNKLGDVQALLNRGDNPNFVDGAGRTPLGYAAALGNAAMAQLLLEHGARVDYRDNFGNTALHWAAENGRTEMVKLLLAAKAPVDATNKQGITPLMQAAGANKADVVRVLLKGGADPRKQDFTGRDALGWAAGKPSTLRVLQTAHAE